MTAQYKAGEAAFKQGAKLYENPHRIGSAHYRQWGDGWSAARMRQGIG